jgi:hypothetical protein
MVQAVVADRRPFTALLAANVVSQISNMMTAVAVPWFVLETTGNAALVGLASAAIVPAMRRMDTQEPAGAPMPSEPPAKAPSLAQARRCATVKVGL